MQFAKSWARAPFLAELRAASWLLCRPTYARRIHRSTAETANRTEREIFSYIFLYKPPRAAQMKQHFLSRKCDLCAFECKRRTGHAPHLPSTIAQLPTSQFFAPTGMLILWWWKLLWQAKNFGSSRRRRLIKRRDPRPPGTCVRVCLLTEHNWYV